MIRLRAVPIWEEWRREISLDDEPESIDLLNYQLINPLLRHLDGEGDLPEIRHRYTTDQILDQYRKVCLLSDYLLTLPKSGSIHKVYRGLPPGSPTLSKLRSGQTDFHFPCLLSSSGTIRGASGFAGPNGSYMEILTPGLFRMELYGDHECESLFPMGSRFRYVESRKEMQIVVDWDQIRKTGNWTRPESTIKEVEIWTVEYMGSNLSDRDRRKMIRDIEKL